MLLSDIFEIIGKPFLYYPQFCKLLDISVNECVLFCFIGWKSKKGDNGWVFLASDEIVKATGLGPKELLNARRKLVKLGAIEEEYKRLSHQMFYRVARREMQGGGTSPNGGSPPAETADGEMPERLMGNSPNGSSHMVLKIKTNKGEAVKAQKLPPEALRWNEVCGHISRVLNVSGDRERHLAARRREPFWVESYESALCKIAASDFCGGKSDRAWVATFDWILQPGSLTKVMEGKYANRNGHRPEARPMHERFSLNG